MGQHIRGTLPIGQIESDCCYCLRRLLNWQNPNRRIPRKLTPSLPFSSCQSETGTTRNPSNRRSRLQPSLLDVFCRLFLCQRQTVPWHACRRWNLDRADKMVFAGGPYVGSHDGDDDEYDGGGGGDDGRSSNFGFCGSPVGQTDWERNLSGWEWFSTVLPSQPLCGGADRRAFGFVRVHLSWILYASCRESVRIRWRASDKSSCSNAGNRSWANKRNPRHRHPRLPQTLRPTCCNCFEQNAVWNRCSFAIGCCSRRLTAASSDPIRSLGRFHFGPAESSTATWNQCFNTWQISNFIRGTTRNNRGNVTSTHFELLIFGGIVERRTAEFIQGDFGPFGQQPAHDVDVSTAGGEMQRRSSVTVLGVDVHGFGRDLHGHTKKVSNDSIGHCKCN